MMPIRHQINNYKALYFAKVRVVRTYALNLLIIYLYFILGNVYNILQNYYIFKLIFIYLSVRLFFLNNLTNLAFIMSFLLYLNIHSFIA